VLLNEIKVFKGIPQLIELLNSTLLSRDDIRGMLKKSRRQKIPPMGPSILAIGGIIKSYVGRDEA
jgi:hypothetical protein